MIIRICSVERGCDWATSEEACRDREPNPAGAHEGRSSGRLRDPAHEDEEDQLDDESLARKVAPEALQELEDELLRVVSGSLMREPKLHSPGDPVRAHLLELLSRIGPSDPEFVLKAALYAREELNIRTTANFLLAAAASIPPCRRHLRR
eukprot:tig00020961_g16752.t1